MTTANFATTRKRAAQHEANQWTLEVVGGEERQKIIVATRPHVLLLPALHVVDNIHLKNELLFDANNFICIERKRDVALQIRKELENLGLHNAVCLRGDFFWVFNKFLSSWAKYKMPSYADIGHIDADLIQCFDVQCRDFLKDCIRYEIPSIHLTIDTHGGRESFKELMYKDYGYDYNDSHQKEKIESILQDPSVVPPHYRWHIIPYEGIGDIQDRHKSHMVMVLLQKVKQ
jgi:hypothetical protein